MKKKSLVDISITLPEDIYFAMLIYCGTHRITLDKFVETAIQHAIKGEVNEKEKVINTRVTKKSNNR
jgi:hypothetical protein